MSVYTLIYITAPGKGAQILLSGTESRCRDAMKLHIRLTKPDVLSRYLIVSQFQVFAFTGKGEVYDM